jgi:hypothetical protein
MATPGSENAKPTVRWAGLVMTRAMLAGLGVVGLLACGNSANSVAPGPTITALVVTPATAGLVSGAIQQFTVSATLSDGTTQPNPAVTWTATGGSVTTHGLYTAGVTGGTFRVSATQSGGTVTGSADITVLPVGVLYTTLFPLTENPISEAGNWITGKAVGLDWSDVATASGRAFGTQSGTANLDDAIAIVQGAWGPDQSATATVFSVNPNDVATQEVELLLRFSITAHNAHGYEINFRAPTGGYIEVARWNGPLSDFTLLKSVGGTLANGDVVKATAIGNVITVYKNGVQVLQVTDGTWATGSPGIGFFRRNNGAANTDFGFTRFTATDFVIP